MVAHDLKAPLAGVKNNVELLRDFYSDKLDPKGVEFVEASLRILGRSFALIDSPARIFEVGPLGQAPFPGRPGGRRGVRSGRPADRHRQRRRAGRDRLATASSRRRNGTRPTAPKPRRQRPQVSRPGPSRGKTCFEPSKGRWVVSVADNGIGIHPKHASEIFAPFKHRHSRKEFEGSGIGLATCKKIVEQHGWRIWVESVPGRGTTFRFTLAAAGADDTSPDRADAAARTPDSLPVA